MLKDRLDYYAALPEQKLGELLGDAAIPALLKESMAYSVFSGGKRLRPSLCMAACELCGGTAEDALLPACAVELIHTYSLIHDDLPAMDNEKCGAASSSHIAFGEANAILAGDGLQALAFAILADCPAVGAQKHIARGAFEMVMGQSLDCNACGGAEILETLQDYKTAALFRAAVGAGAAARMPVRSRRTPACVCNRLRHAVSDYGRHSRLYGSAKALASPSAKTRRREGDLRYRLRAGGRKTRNAFAERQRKPF
jgi:geranylgeranyl diphosphate synthase type II